MISYIISHLCRLNDSFPLYSSKVELIFDSGNFGGPAYFVGRLSIIRRVLENTFWEAYKITRVVLVRLFISCVQGENLLKPQFIFRKLILFGSWGRTKLGFTSSQDILSHQTLLKVSWWSLQHLIHYYQNIYI